MRIPTDPGDWSTVPLDNLLDHVVVAYHAPLVTKLESTVEALRRAGPAVARAARRCAALCELGKEHVLREAELVFPCLRQRNRASASLLVAQLEREHAEMHRDADEILALVPRGVEATVTREISDLQRLIDEHAWFEDRVLFPRALAAAAE